MNSIIKCSSIILGISIYSIIHASVPMQPAHTERLQTNTWCGKKQIEAVNKQNKTLKEIAVILSHKEFWPIISEYLAGILIETFDISLINPTKQLDLVTAKFDDKGKPTQYPSRNHKENSNLFNHLKGNIGGLSLVPYADEHSGVVKHAYRLDATVGHADNPNMRATVRWMIPSSLCHSYDLPDYYGEWKPYVPEKILSRTSSDKLYQARVIDHKQKDDPTWSVDSGKTIEVTMNLQHALAAVSSQTND